MRRTLSLVALIALAFASPRAAAKSLYWRAIDVDAQLDRDGRLHVVEQQAIVFDGDWNGGERTFDIRRTQHLDLEGVDRIEGGQAIPLQEGSLEAVDHYALNDSTLRWRSRLPSDPPFDNKEIIYRIRYTLTGVLRGHGNVFALAHDFAFPKRSGEIRHFTVRLTADPVWRGIKSPLVEQASDLRPGRGYVVRRTLTFAGSGTPAGAVQLPPAWPGRLFALALAAAIALLAVRFYAAEKSRGRFGSLTPPETIDEAWLREHVFALPPEIAGAAIDNKVGAPEVAAVLAGLAQEKKIASTVDRPSIGHSVLHMKLLTDRASIEGYRRELVTKLFFGGRTETDTDAVRKHYASSGLDLAAVIRDPIQDRLDSLPGWTKKEPVAKWGVLAGMLVVALALLIAAKLRGGNDDALAGEGLFFGAIALLGGFITARLNSRAMTTLVPRFILLFAFPAPLLYFTFKWLLMDADYGFSLFAMTAVVVWTAAVFHFLFDAMRTDESPDKIAFRARLVSARRFFMSQLKEPNPRLHDDWFPYLLAFGLGSNVDSWFKAYGSDSASMVAGTRDTFSSGSSSSGSSSSGSSSGSSWSGGGGAFGGAGASGSWAVAAGALGSGVAAPSSNSGGGGGGGGGGSSSGGGGGGGW